jgi:chromosome segregation ATPase
MPTKKQLESENADLQDELADAREQIERLDAEIKFVDDTNKNLSERYGSALVELQEERNRRLDLAEQYGLLSQDVAELSERSVEIISDLRAHAEGLDNHNQYLVATLGAISLYQGPDPATPASLAFAAIDEVLPEIGVVSESDGIDQ